MSYRELEQELKFELAKAQAVLDTAVDSIITISPNGNIISFNRASERLFGYEAKEVVGQNIKLLMPLPYRHEHDRYLKNYLETGMSKIIGIGREVVGMRKDGNVFPIELAVSEVAIGEKKIFTGIIRDISKNKLVEQELKESKVKAEDANIAKSLFLANMSHEIRTPLNGVVGAISLLNNSKLNDNQKRYVKIANVSAQNLLTLISDILDLSKVEAGQLEIERIDFNIRLIIEDLLDAMAYQANEHKLDLGSHVARDVPSIVFGDPKRLQQILRNLWSNAIKFTENGHVTLEVEKCGEDSIYFAIEDSGIGISEKQQKKLFKSFFQAESSTSRKYGGTGLGLAICKQLVELMHGEIGMESHEKKGSKFWFTLPFERSEERSIEQPPIMPWASTLRVLVVDKHEAHTHILLKQINSWGMRGDKATSGTQALAALRNASSSDEPFTVVIVDYSLSQDEMSLLIQAVDEQPDTEESVVMLMNNMTNDVDYRRFEQMGISGFLPKPVHQSTLLDEIMNAITHSKDYSSIGPSVSERGAVRNAQSLIKASLLLKNKRILLVEDNEINQFVASEMLELLGCCCDTARNGVEAVELATRKFFDLIFMDCQMPKMDGFEATRIIRDNERETGRHRVPIVAVTANVLKGDSEYCYEAGMDDYVAKPLDLDKLVQVLMRTFSGTANPVRRISSSRNASTNHNSPINVEEVLKRCMNNRDVVRVVFEKFREQAESDIEILRAAVSAVDSQRVFETAHSLKGAANMVHSERLSEEAMKLEEMGRNGVLNNANEQLNALEREVELCLNYLPEAIKRVS